ncbi:right-handed parallel beta-helix repeat-containing protein [Bosea sp. CS1GBMeth4]|uniref:right-handed parallel beta-helix repeat-containing protein n=1 Tax=Bosea sp. CS1GBMeth4 TaxID=1892849 RepID=UPI001FCEC1E7|nr:right-handed parallel beta-helix repeat-containing protein [Bosea sp. CS1GBMeth4]
MVADIGSDIEADAVAEAHFADELREEIEFLPLVEAVGQDSEADMLVRNHRQAGRGAAQRRPLAADQSLDGEIPDPKHGAHHLSPSPLAPLRMRAVASTFPMRSSNARISLFDDVVVADPATPPPAGFTSATIGAAIDAARVTGRPLLLRPGSYDIANVDISTTTGSGRGIEIYCPAGTATLFFSGGNYGLRIAGQTGMTFRNLTFDGQNLDIPAYNAPTVITAAAGLVILDNARDATFRDCTFRNTVKTDGEPGGAYKAGLLCVNDSQPVVADCAFDNVDIAIWAFSSEILADGCSITGAKNNGIAVWGTVGSGGNLSVIRNNRINFVTSDYGTGANGNGIAVTWPMMSPSKTISL